MARIGDSEEKRREAYRQHNGWFVGTIKYLNRKLNPFKEDD